MPHRLYFNTARPIALLAGGGYAIWRGFRYIPGTSGFDSLPEGLSILSNGFGLEAWAVLWFAVGGACLFFAFWKQHLDAFAWGPLVSVMSVWALAYFVGGISVWDPLIGWDVPEQTDSWAQWMTMSSYLFPAVWTGLLAINTARAPRRAPVMEATDGAG